MKEKVSKGDRSKGHEYTNGYRNNQDDKNTGLHGFVEKKGL